MRLIKNKTSINFLGEARRRIALFLSIIMVSISISSIFIKGMEFGIDFTGGEFITVFIIQEVM